MITKKVKMMKKMYVVGSIILVILMTLSITAVPQIRGSSVMQTIKQKEVLNVEKIKDTSVYMNALGGGFLDKIIDLLLVIIDLVDRLINFLEVLIGLSELIDVIVETISNLFQIIQDFIEWITSLLNPENTKQLGNNILY